jgi:hypothetical protein
MKIAPRHVVAWMARIALVVYGLWAMEHLALTAFGGAERLLKYTNNDAHRFTARAMLHGSLTMRNALSLIWHDEQLFNGADYTNWGFGVPLLQMPFEWLAGRKGGTPNGFYPDHKIFFVYMAGTLPLLWAALHRLLAHLGPGEDRHSRRIFFSWTAALVVASCAVFPIAAARFIQYEEAIAYFVLVELWALSAYAFAVGTWGTEAVVALGLAAGLGLVVRPTGLVYLGAWGAMALLEHPKKRTLFAFAGGAAPFVAFWLYTNWVRTGSPLATGFINSIPYYDWHMPAQRFGNVCIQNAGNMKSAAKLLFNILFLSTAYEPDEWLKTCHFDVEGRPRTYNIEVPSDPYLGLGVLALLVWIALHLVRMKERRLAFYVPLGVIAALFGVFVVRGNGFAWRYIGDFWPAIVLACVQYTRAVSNELRSQLGVRLGLVFLACSWTSYQHEVVPALKGVEYLAVDKVAALAKTYAANRDTRDAPLPTRVTCHDHPTLPFHNGSGWKPDCSVASLTNLFIGVPPKGGDHYTLTFQTAGVTAPELLVYVNGRFYWAHKDGDAYRADVTIHYGRLVSPTVILTIQWTKELDGPPGAQLLSLELN